MNRRLYLLASSATLALALVPLRVCAWEPGAADLEKAVAGGDFAAYHTNLTQWLRRQAPAEPTEAALKALLTKAEFVTALDQHRFIAQCTPASLDRFAKFDARNQPFLKWLLQDAGVMDLYLEAGGTPAGDACIPTLGFWSKVYNTDPDSHQGICLKIAIATALTRPAPFQDERATPRVTDPYEGRYLYYKKAHQNGDLLPVFDHLTLWEYRKVVDALGAPPQDLTWVREMIHAWRPDLKRENRMVKIVSEVRYGTSPLPIVDMASVLDAGGMCERRAHFGIKTCAAYGIPAIKILQRNHAAMAWKQGDTWKVEYGAGWPASWLEGGQDGWQFVAEAAARSHVAEFSQSEHLKWLAAATDNPAAAKAITDIAAGLVPTNVAVTAKEPETKAEMESDAASAPTSAANAGEASPGAAPAEEGAIRLAADTFEKMANVMVYDSLPDGTGKQVNFQKNINDSWIDYTVTAPAAGTYALVLKVAAPNRDQFLSVTVGTNAAARIAVPNTRGLWGFTPALDLPLAQGKQTLRLAAPFQRGVAVKWLELKPAAKAGDRGSAS